MMEEIQPRDETHQGAAGPASGEMRPLDPRHIWVLRIRIGIVAAVLVLGLAILDMGPIRDLDFAPAQGVVPLAAAALLALAAFLLPVRRYRAWGYCEQGDELHIRYGLWVRTRTAVPFARVQHIDVAQGPLQRPFGLATLVLHTAGTRGAAISLPGLSHGDAEEMRDRIRGAIRQDLL